MTLSLRGALVLVIGVVLGLSLAFSPTVWTALTTHHATLEDVFMSLTGRKLRDG